MPAQRCCFICGLVKCVDPVSFHRFPKDPEKIKTWTNFFNLPSDSAKNYNTEHIRICSRHFQTADFIECKNSQKKLLRPNAVPSIKLDINETVRKRFRLAKSPKVRKQKQRKNDDNDKNESTGNNPVNNEGQGQQMVYKTSCPKTCVVCRFQSHLSQSYFRFPKDNRRSQWLAACNINSVTDEMRLCSRHFADDCFVRTPGSSKRAALRSTAMPTLFLPKSSETIAQDVEIQDRANGNASANFYVSTMTKICDKINVLRSEADNTDITNTQGNAIEVENLEDPLPEIISVSTAGAICAEVLQTEVNKAEVTPHTEKNVTGLLVEMKRQPTTRKRKLPKNKSGKVYRLPIRQKIFRSSTSKSVRTQTEVFMDWKKFLTMAHLDRYSMNIMFGLPSLYKIVKFLKMWGINETIMKIPDQLILTIWKYRFNLNLNSYSYMFSYNEKTALSSDILNDCFHIGTESLYRYVQEFEERNIQELGRLMSRRIYLDVFEIPVVSHLTFDQMNYSTQRGTTTFKTIVLFVGNLQYFYVSDLYGGSTKISHIIKTSQIGNVVRPDDYIIYSKKITESEASLINANIVDSFPDDRKMLFSTIEMRLRKQFKILNESLPIHYWPIANQIFHNCVSLFNMSLKGTVVTQK
ncbi:uncharacterized protein LOC123299921 [Chrysoperla carnea]|uniref:uncharacterized protein LOC123299921 n=1 Tax=Chrysoperla carnea TaxID=189513 RepID=UPI001D08AAB4|nr:uncharacterized protein LOC123299921 [Chrysoperla carnea]